MMPRCVNLDWLEVHALESAEGFPHDADYFRRMGSIVNERDYGTRVYREMFTVCDAAGNPFVEVRRNPASQGALGIHSPYECHLRLVNAACYLDGAAQLLADFMAAHGFAFSRIVRVDVCLDFERFDHGDDPQRFLQRYLRNVYGKINQGNISAHGADRWDGQIWHSISWGAPTSDIGTKFYNKTLELFDPSSNSYRKPHVRWAWFQCGLVDDFHRVTKRRPDGSEYTPQIWRVEFSIRSSVKKWFVIELNGKARAYQSIRNTLEMYDCRSKLLTIFASLANHYFRFKYLIKRYDFYKSGSTEGKAVRKDRCPDKILFDFKGEQLVYKVDKSSPAHLLRDSRATVRPLDSLLAKLRAYASNHPYGEVHEACQVLIRTIEGETLRSDMRNPFSLDELRTLQITLSAKLRGSQQDVTVLMAAIKEVLGINDNTAIF